MIELNKVLLVGRLTRDPDYRNTPSGRPVVKLGLAVNRRWNNKETGSMQEEVVFIDVDAWDRNADFAKNYLHKGSGVFVEGRLKQDNWQDKDSGQNRSKLFVVADRITFAESKAEAERHSGGGSGPSNYSNNQGAPGGPDRGDRRPEPAAAREPGYEPESTNDDLPF